MADGALSLTWVDVRTATDVVEALALARPSQTGLVVHHRDPELLRALARWRWCAVVGVDEFGQANTSRDDVELELTRRHRYIDPALAPALMDALHHTVAHTDPLNTLTQREREVLRHLAEGGTNRQIAQALYVSEHTVRNQLRSVYRKLGVSTRHQAREIYRGFVAQEAALG